MSVSRTTIVRSPGVVTFGGVTLYPQADINVDYKPDFEDVMSGLHGRIDQFKKDFKIPVRLKLWGAIENLSVLFPSGALTPVPGTSLCSDAQLTLWGKNGDKVIFYNAFISKVADLYLGVDKDYFEADVEFMCLIKSGANPEDAAAYFIRSNASFTDPGPFAKTNFLHQRYTLAWGARIASLEMREGIHVAWQYDVQYDYSANYGTDNAYIGANGFRGELKGIPATTVAIIEAQSLGQGTGLGVLGSSASADLVATGSSSHTVTLKNAFMAQHAECFDIKKLRAQEVLFRTTTAFATTVRAAEAALT